MAELTPRESRKTAAAQREYSRQLGVFYSIWGPTYLRPGFYRQTRKYADGVVEALRVAAGNACTYCHTPFVAERNHVHEMTVDHVIPISRGGSCSVENLTAACRQCNTKKGKKTAKEWLS